jgi:ABC-type enterochelin transport system ATPase subunit
MAGDSHTCVESSFSISNTLGEAALDSVNNEQLDHTFNGSRKQVLVVTVQDTEYYYYDCVINKFYIQLFVSLHLPLNPASNSLAQELKRAPFEIE